MQRKRFEELTASVREAGRIMRGEVKPDRKTTLGEKRTTSVMKSKKGRLITAICSFPREYRTLRTISPREWIQTSGYLDQHQSITQEEIEDAIRADVSLIKNWVHFCQDKRWTPAWTIGKRGRLWVVGLVDKNGRLTCQVVCKGSVEACALLVRMEMEELRLAVR